MTTGVESIAAGAAATTEAEAVVVAAAHAPRQGAETCGAVREAVAITEGIQSLLMLALTRVPLPMIFGPGRAGNVRDRVEMNP